MTFGTVVHYYWLWVRTHPVHELLAGCGVAIGVALAFAVMVANASVANSANEVVHAVVGRADLQLTSRDPRGFDERVLAEVERLPGVERTAPLLEQRGVISGPAGHGVPVNVASVDPQLALLSGRLAGIVVAARLERLQGIILPSATARRLDLPDPATGAVVGDGPDVTLALRGRSIRMPVAAVLGPETVGPVADAAAAVLPLRRLQRLAGLEGRISRVLVETDPTTRDRVRQQLLGVALRNNLVLSDADMEVDLLAQAIKPSNQATAFFAAISALLGFLLAFNAMLLTAPERRRRAAALRLQGAHTRQLVAISMFQAAVLGAIASTIGVLVGHVLSRSALSESPDYLEPAFTLGTRTAPTAPLVLVCLLGGVLACCLAATPPLLDARRGRAVDAVFRTAEAPGQALSARARRIALLGALVLVTLATAILVAAPALALLGCGLLALGTVLAVPSVFKLVLVIGGAVAERVPGSTTLFLALTALRATTLRSLALAATGGVAVFGSVAIAGARDDLLRGIDRYTADYVGTADLWIVNPHDNQATNDVVIDDIAETVARVPGVADAREYQGGFLDIGDRRIWIIARPSRDRAIVPPSQLVDGDLAAATEALRRPGSVAVSDQLADHLAVEVGDRVTLPTPTGNLSLRVVATTTNLGWAPGAIVINRADYRRAWATDAPTAVEVDIGHHAVLTYVMRSLRQALSGSALTVLSSDQRAERIRSSARQGLDRLGQISSMLLVAAVLAMAAAMSAAIWERRPQLAALRIQSGTPRQLWRILLTESALVLGAGCLAGAVAGVFGQIGIDRYLRFVTGFPVAVDPAGWPTVRTFLLVVAAALLVVAVPGWVATRVRPEPLKE